MVPRRVAVVAAGIVAGMVLGIWLTEVAIGGAAGLWIAYHQAIRGPYTLVVPPLGAVALVASVAALSRSAVREYPTGILLAAVGLPGARACRHGRASTSRSTPRSTPGLRPRPR